MTPAQCRGFPNPPPPPTEGLLAHYSLDEGNGTVAWDSSGNGHTGTLVNGPQWFAGMAVDFDGQNDYIDIGALEQAQVLRWSNVVENEGLAAVAEVLRNWSPGFRDRALPGPIDLEQIPALIERGRKRCRMFFDRIEQQLGHCTHLAAERFSVKGTQKIIGPISFTRCVGRGAIGHIRLR